MTSKMIVLVLTLKEDQIDEDYTSYDLHTAQVVGSHLTHEQLDGLVEGLAQSDFGYIGFPNGIMEALTSRGERVEFDHRNW